MIATAHRQEYAADLRLGHQSAVGSQHARRAGAGQWIDSTEIEVHEESHTRAGFPTGAA